MMDENQISDLTAVPGGTDLSKAEVNGGPDGTSLELIATNQKLNALNQKQARVRISSIPAIWIGITPSTPTTFFKVSRTVFFNSTSYKYLISQITVLENFQLKFRELFNGIGITY